MSSDPRLAKLPALLKLAEEWAMRHYALLRYRLVSPTQSGGPPWNDLDARYREAAIDAAMDWLGDLRYPEAWDAVARLVAESEGLDVKGGIVFTRQSFASRKKGDWLMLDWNGKEIVVLRGTTVTDPAKALTLIALHVLGSPDADR